jgi:plastocyanin
MRRFVTAAGLAAMVLGVSACSSYDNPSPTAPAPAAPPPGAIVIDVVAIKGAQSFSPSPTAAAAGQTVVWHNVDTVTHRVVLNDGELDTGNIPPGGYSAALPLVEPSPYHCSIHPEMVGTIVAPK